MVGERAHQLKITTVDFDPAGPEVCRIEEGRAGFGRSNGKSFVDRAIRAAIVGVVNRDNPMLACAPGLAQSLCGIEVGSPTDNRPVLGSKKESRCSLSVRASTSIP